MAEASGRRVLAPGVRLCVASALTLVAGVVLPAPAEAQFFGWSGYSSPSDYSYYGSENTQTQRRRTGNQAEGRGRSDRTRKEAARNRTQAEGRRTQGEGRRTESEGSARKARKTAASPKPPAAKSGPSFEISGTAYGPLQVVISLKSQSLKVYNGSGTQIASSRISSGREGFETPTGVFSILQKNEEHYSNLYDDAPMPYMQRLTWSGVALHAGKLPGYPASHGCIRLPHAFAVKLFEMTRMGGRVIVADGAPVPAAIRHPVLDAVSKPAAKENDDREPGEVIADVAMTGALRLSSSGDEVKVADASGTIGGRLPASIRGAAPQRRTGPVTVLISRREGRILVRRDGDTLYDRPIRIADAGRPIGLHVFTVGGIDAKGQGARWLVTSLMGEVGARLALERVEIPADIAAHVGPMLTAGSTLMIADSGVSPETTRGIDYIVHPR